jgi:hypothetical protein
MWVVCILAASCLHIIVLHVGYVTLLCAENTKRHSGLPYMGPLSFAVRPETSLSFCSSISDNFRSHRKFCSTNIRRVLYRVIRKSLCTWWLQYGKLQAMFKVSPASLQTFIDTPNCVLEDRVQYSTVHIPNVFCDGHLHFCVFFVL